MCIHTFGFEAGIRKIGGLHFGLPDLELWFLETY
jgi:hypothetical protein